MTAAEIFERIHKHGGNVSLMPDRHRLRIEHRSRIPDNLAAEAKAHIEELRMILLAREAVAAAERISQNAAIRERRFPLPELKVCPFPIGAAGETCRRCGASPLEHYGT